MNPSFVAHSFDSFVASGAGNLVADYTFVVGPSAFAVAPYSFLH